MSMIPAEYSAIRSARATSTTAAKRLPRAAGLLSAAVMSAGLWYVAFEALRLVS
jgi:hypothetical protein